ncbi:beta-propeller domain-containing protein [Pelotomaculum propionicicum]|uniref:beta-propeller domain-containing protein n=1 Tax=Pelotomaculum propionicicum TaxID=258475 RepID=UPI003B8204CE
MRKIVVLGIILFTLAGFLINYSRASAEPDHSAIFTAGQRAYTSDGLAKAMDAQTFIENNRAYVPMRYLALSLGISDENIAWNSSSQSVTLAQGDVTVSAAIGGSTLYVNGQPSTMDVAPVLRDSRAYLPARYIAEAFGYTVDWHQATQSVLIGPPGGLPQPAQGEAAFLPSVGSYENLKELLKNKQAQYEGELDFVTGAVPAQSMAREESKAAPGAAPGGSSDNDYSRTNVQVEGVDEADIVKTDGNYIYQVNKERIVIAEAYPPEGMSVVSTLSYADKAFSPAEIYVDGTYLVVIGRTINYYPPLYKVDTRIMPEMMPPYHYQGENMKAIIYNIEDKANVRQVRELELNGSYVSSRKTGDSLYLIANKNIYYYPGREIDEPKPMYRDSAAGGGFVEIDYPDIKCFPDFAEPSYLIVAGLKLDSPGEAASVSSYLGSGQNIYASTDNLYVAVTSYNYYRGPVVPLREAEIWPSYDTSKTKVYKFGLDDGRLTYKSSGEVPGSILNQFSMDEHNGYFRIATTRGEVWRTDGNTSKNNVYVLDSSLNITGKIEGIAPGEKIYSVRFMGDRAYMVTFKKVDPFFVLDLQDPQNPAILGKLKIPGYSDYLHPYDENHIIGFGKDTVEMGAKEWGGDSMAFYMGMKMAVFDVSDVSNPVEMFREVIGDRGTDSELLHNHKALLFSKDKNLLAFPVRVMEVRSGTDSYGQPWPEYGTFSFQGAYVYNIDLESGFSLKGRITHLAGEDYLKAGNYWYDSEKDVQRILYINNTLYTLSQGMIKANSMGDLTELNKLEIK